MPYSDNYKREGSVGDEKDSRVYYHDPKTHTYHVRQGDDWFEIDLDPEVAKDFLANRGITPVELKSPRRIGRRLLTVMLLAEGVLATTAYATEGNPGAAFDKYVNYHINAVTGSADKTREYIPIDDGRENIPPNSPTAVPSNRPTASSTPSPSSTPSSSSTTQTADTLEQCVSALPDRFKLAQNSGISVTAEGSYLPDPELGLDTTREIIVENNIGSIIVFGDPSKDPNRGILSYTKDPQLAAPMLIASDQEGGVVRRIDNGMPSQEEVSKTMTPEQTATEMRKYYAPLKDYGINGVFGPVVDKMPPNGKSALENERMFTGNGDKIGEYAAAYLEAQQKEGITGFVKHFYGDGSMTAHTDTSSGKVEVPALAQLKKEDAMTPWENLQAPNIMMGTAVGPADETDGLPTALSPTANKLAAEEYGATGIRITDDLGTAAVVNEDGSHMNINSAFVHAWKVGATPIYANLPHEKPIGGLAKRIDSLLKSGLDAIEAGTITEKTLNHMTLQRYGQLGINACVVRDKIVND